MSLTFTYKAHPATIVFSRGASGLLGEWIERIGCRRALVLSTAQQAGDAARVAQMIGTAAAGTFAQAAMHTPSDVSERAADFARGLQADCLVAFGGGSTTGLSKAIALRTGLPQIVIPTTYAGSEVTDILGQTENGLKTTLRDKNVLPDIVLYDPELTVGLPVSMSVTSGLNAMAHAAEALYAADRNPVTTLMATEGLRSMRDALAVISRDPGHIDARDSALYGAWMCGTVLGMAAMALHHKLCHVLGGSFDTPHAETHAVMLPHTIAYNAHAVPELLKPLADLFEGRAGAGLWDFSASVDAPMSLKAFGLSQRDLDRAAELATTSPYTNPRPIDRTSIRKLLQDAWDGRRPEI